MNEDYDAIILGTGLKECLLSGLLSVTGKKTLHLDRSRHYGGKSASLDLHTLFERYPEQIKNEKDAFGHNRYWNVDTVPKFILANGQLTKILVRAEISKREYMHFQKISGSYVFRNNRIHKIPTTVPEILGTKLMGLFEKGRFRKFLEFVRDFKAEEPSTHRNFDMSIATAREVFAQFRLEPDTVDFVGHAMALYRTDDYLDDNAVEMLERVVLYCESLSRYGSTPYIYPLYGLGELPQSFARLSAVFGGTFMMDKPIDEILYDEEDKVCGIRIGEEVARAPMIVADLSYFPELGHETDRVIRAICFLNHPVPNTEDADSTMIIMPQGQLGRRSDIYITVLSGAHNVCLKGIYLATVSTTVETDDPLAEIQPALALLGEPIEMIHTIEPMLVPNDAVAAAEKGIYISEGYDATSHFETTCSDVSDIWQRITGEDLATMLERYHQETKDRKVEDI